MSSKHCPISSSVFPQLHPINNIRGGHLTRTLLRPNTRSPCVSHEAFVAETLRRSAHQRTDSLQFSAWIHQNTDFGSYASPRPAETPTYPLLFITIFSCLSEEGNPGEGSLTMSLSAHIASHCFNLQSVHLSFIPQAGEGCCTPCNLCLMRCRGTSREMKVMFPVKTR